MSATVVSKNGEEAFVIAVGVKDLELPCTSRCDVVHAVGQLESRATRHEASVGRAAAADGAGA